MILFSLKLWAPSDLRVLIMWDNTMLIMSIYWNPFNDNEKDCDDSYDEKRAWVWIVGVNWGDGNLTDQMDLRWGEVPSDNISQSDKDYHLDHHHHHDDDHILFHKNHENNT